jgi:hypothetical protein
MAQLLRKHYSLKLLGLLFVCFIFAGAQNGYSQQSTFSSENRREAPSITVSETDVDFGEVDEGSLISHDFIVKNTGRTELKIDKVSPD